MASTTDSPSLIVLKTRRGWALCERKSTATWITTGFMEINGDVQQPPEIPYYEKVATFESLDDAERFKGRLRD